MIIKNEKTRILTSGQRDGQRFMEKYDVVCGELAFDADGEKRYITVSWVSAAVDDIVTEISADPIADILCSDLTDEDLDRLDGRRGKALAVISNEEEIFSDQGVIEALKELSDQVLLTAVKEGYLSLDNEDDDNGSRIEIDVFG